MAYGQTGTRTGSYGSASNVKPAAASTAPRGNVATAEARKEFVEDPDKLGYAYQKESEKAGVYWSVTVTKDIPAGTKFMIYVNKTKNPTEKTPTHILKLAKTRTAG